MNVAAAERALGFARYDDEDFASYCAVLRWAFVFASWTSQADLLSFYNAHDLAQAAFGTLYFALSFASLLGLGGNVVLALFGVVTLIVRHYVGPFDGRPDLIYQHETVIGTVFLILAATPTLNRWSLRRRNGPGMLAQERILLLLRLQVVTIYLFSGYHKLAAAATGALQLQTTFMAAYTGSFGAIQPVHQAWFLAATWIIGAFEILLAAGLVFGRTRRFGVGLAIAFHCVLYPFLPVHVFSVIMILLLPVFLSRESFRATVQFMR